MSAALVAALRDSCGYLRDDGYHQTAQLMLMAADEIERLNRHVHALQADGTSPTAARRAVDHLREIVKANSLQAGYADRDPRRNRK